MSLLNIIWSLGVFWIVVHLLYRSLLRTTGKNLALLPTQAVRSNNDRITPRRKFFGFPLSISLQYVHLKLETIAFNTTHATLTTFLVTPKNIRLQKAVRVFYDVGSVASILGLFFAFGLLSWTAGQVSWRCYDILSASHTTPAGSLGKRSYSDESDTGRAEGSGLAINPIIPGITVPFWHIPHLIISLFLSQVIHEAGHALAAALEGLSLRAVGISLTLVFPSAFTSLSPFDGTSSYPPAARIRILAAGAWHNLVLYMALCVCMKTLPVWKEGRLWSVFGYRDISGSGRVVMGLEDDSPLVYHLPLGALIIALDDTPLSSPASVESSYDPWTDLLLNHPTQKEEAAAEGWCVDAAWFEGQPETCCPPHSNPDFSQPPAAQLSCFTYLDSTSVSMSPARCIDPFPLLVPTSASSTPRRCSSLIPCNFLDTTQAESGDSDHKKSYQACVRPHESAQILRIFVELPPWLWTTDDGGITQESSRTNTVLWSGPRREVWEQVEVGIYQPRSAYLPIWLPEIVSLYFAYLSTLTLSLYVFNLLCLPFLDGSELLTAILDLVGDTRSNDGLEQNDGFAFNLEAGNTWRSGEHSPPSLPFSSSFVRRNGDFGFLPRYIRRRKKHIERVAMTTTIALAGIAIGGGMLMSMLDPG